LVVRILVAITTALAVASCTSSATDLMSTPGRTTSPSAGGVIRMSVQVPSLVGVPVERAVARLRRLGLNSRVWSGLVDSSFGSDILGQQPRAGTAVAPGTTIRLYIS
jgi:hypothetical protein